MIRLGYHRSLVGGIASRPRLPQKDLAMKFILDYSSRLNLMYHAFQKPFHWINLLPTDITCTSVFVNACVPRNA